MADSAQKYALEVSGMTCGHCRMAVESALREVPGVTSAHVDLERGIAIVEGKADLQSLLDAVDEAGYEATPSGAP